MGGGAAVGPCLGIWVVPRVVRRVSFNRQLILRAGVQDVCALARSTLQCGVQPWGAFAGARAAVRLVHWPVGCVPGASMVLFSSTAVKGKAKHHLGFEDTITRSRAALGGRWPLRRAVHCLM